MGAEAIRRIGALEDADREYQEGQLIVSNLGKAPHRWLRRHGGNQWSTNPQPVIN